MSWTLKTSPRSCSIVRSKKDDSERRVVKQMWGREINTSLLEEPNTYVTYTDVLLSFCGVYGRE